MKDEEGGENGTFGAREIMSFFDSLARSHLDTLSYPIYPRYGPSYVHLSAWGSPMSNYRLILIKDSFNEVSKLLLIRKSTPII